MALSLTEAAATIRSEVLPDFSSWRFLLESLSVESWVREAPFFKPPKWVVRPATSGSLIHVVPISSLLVRWLAFAFDAPQLTDGLDADLRAFANERLVERAGHLAIELGHDGDCVLLLGDALPMRRLHDQLAAVDHLLGIVDDR